MATPPKSKSPLDIIKDAQEIIKAQSTALIGDLQRKLQEVADTIKIIRETTGKDVLDDPALEQALTQMGVYPIKPTITKVKAAKPLQSVKDTDTAKAIVEALKKHGKPMDVAGIVKATDGKKSTVTQYTLRLVNEGVLVRPSRGMYEVK
jgi:Fic family protein